MVRVRVRVRVRGTLRRHEPTKAWKGLDQRAASRSAGAGPFAMRYLLVR